MPPDVELRCKAFLFDLDGVVVDSRSVVERTWRRWAEPRDAGKAIIEGSWHSSHERRSFVSMTDEFKTKLQTLLQAYAAQAPKQQPADKASRDQADRRMCGERLHSVVRPVLEGLLTELKSAGHEASVREHIERDDAYPSVALSFTPRSGLASALIFRYDPRHGIVVQREVKHAPWKGRPPTGTGDRLGTIGITAVSEPWVETKSLSFIEAVLKAN